MRIPNVLGVEKKDPVENEIISNLRRAYHAATCSNGPYSSCETHDMVWKHFNTLAYKILNKKLK